MEDIILTEGDIVILENGESFVINFMTGSSLKDYNRVHGRKIVEVKRPVEYETIYKKPQEILDKEEKEYLSAVIRPFKNKITYISKKQSQFESGREIIVIYTNMRGGCLPSFRENTMYKGMELNKNYTLEELGL